MFGWFFYALLATLIYGVIAFLYKKAGEHNASTIRVINRSSIIVVFISLMFVIFQKGDYFWGVSAAYAFFNATFFSVAAIFQMHALKFAPTSYVLPVEKFNNIIVITLSISVLSERPTLLQWSGIILSFITIGAIVWAIKKDKGEIVSLKKGVLFSFISAIGSGCSIFTGKLASNEVSTMPYIFMSYFLVMIYTFLISIFLLKKSKNIRAKLFIPSDKYGFLIGVLNFFGYYSILTAFSKGPLSLIQAIFSISMVISIFMAVIFLKEPFDKKKGIILVVAMAAVILIKI
ncbi:DMT family transporter [bacterium]|nr:DMT family transporter [bacterium]